VTALQPFQLGNLHMAKGSGNAPLAADVSLPSTDFTNGAHYRLPWAVSRDLQAVAMSGKELYFRVTDSLLKDVAHGGGVQTGFDFEFSMLDGTAVPYVIKSYDGAAGTLMGVFNPKALAGSAAATRGYLYFDNPAWAVSKEDPDQTFPNATSVLFLPSGIDRSGSKLDFDANLPTSDKVIVNPGALVDGSQVAGNDIERALLGDCGSFLISFLCQSIPSSVDNSPLTFGSGTGTTVIYLRHCFATPNGPHPTTDITNCWRVGFATGGKEADYETAQDTADQTLQHIVFRRVLGSRPELYINGVLSPFSFTFEDIGILSSRLDFTNQKLIVGRGSVSSSRWWNGYLDCFKFFKDDAKSATWALAEYSNLMDIDGGVIFGSPETVSTSSVFGETIKVQADQLTSVDFKADKYSATVGGTIALRASAPFDNPANGRFTDRGANTVRYTNTKAVDPDNDGAIHLTNGVGNVVIPVRAKIILTAPPPPSGYYKTPNTFVGDVTTKTVNVSTAGANSRPSSTASPTQPGQRPTASSLGMTGGLPTPMAHASPSTRVGRRLTHWSSSWTTLGLTRQRAGQADPRSTTTLSSLQRHMSGSMASRLSSYPRMSTCIGQPLMARLRWWNSKPTTASSQPPTCVVLDTSTMTQPLLTLMTSRATTTGLSGSSRRHSLWAMVTTHSTMRGGTPAHQRSHSDGS
jgi:hypothetical protein